MQKYLLYTLFIFSISFISCSQDKEPVVQKTERKKVKKKKNISPLVIAPIPEMDIAFETIQVNPVYGGVYEVPNTQGSKLVVDPLSFVDKNRKPITTNIEIKYREFHDAIDIFLSGIPMEYDAAGMQKHFETAGMFDIRAFTNGKEVFLDSGKVVKVIFGANTYGDEYRFFHLDEKLTRNWHYIGENKAKGNRDKQKLINAIGSKVKGTKMPLPPGHFSFNYMALLDVYLRDDEKEILKNKKDKTVESKIQQYGVEWMNFYNYQTITFNGNNYLSSLLIWKNLSGKDFPSWGNLAETKLTLKEGNIYELEFNLRGKPKYRFDIEAVMPLKSLLKFAPTYWKNEYEKAFAQAMAAEADKLRTMADVYRSFELNQFGIYNYDKLMKDTLHIQVNADIKFDRDAGDLKNITICYVGGDGKSLIKFPYNLWTNMTLVPDTKGKMFTLLPDNYLAIYSAEEYKKIPFKDLRKQTEKPKLTFQFITIKKITSDEEIKEIVLKNKISGI